MLVGVIEASFSCPIDPSINLHSDVRSDVEKAVESDAKRLAQEKYGKKETLYLIVKNQQTFDHPAGVSSKIEADVYRVK